MTNARATAASAVFTANPSFTVVYVCADNQCFQRAAHASAHANDLSGDKDDYIRVTPAILTLITEINAETTTGAVDADLVGGEEAWVIAFATGKKAELVEAARVATKLSFVASCNDAPALTLLLHGEANATVIAAINAKL